MNIKELDSRTRSLIQKRIIQVLLQFLFTGVILFLSAGSLYWVWAWIYLGLGLASTLIATPVLLRKNPEVIAERAQVKGDTKPFDRVFSIYSLIVTLAMLVTAGLDYRFGWTSNYPSYLYILGFVLIPCGSALLFWAMASNKFFSRTVRIQEERQHAVAKQGPYQIVRHPGYSGMILSTIGTPMLLGSLWALIPAILVILGFMVRTSLEDQTLKSELDGYQNYTHQVQYRLAPGIW